MEAVAWVPGWYELDPYLEVGETNDFAFWRVIPEDVRGPERLVMYNQLWKLDDMIVARGTIVGIGHAELGAVRKVDTRGLSYTIVLADGSELAVNAEEEPGKLYERSAGHRWVESPRVVRRWRFVIEFDSLSEPKPANDEWAREQRRRSRQRPG